MSHFASHGAPARRGAQGFTLVEMLVSMGIFLLICGSAFTLLGVSQQRYASESQVVNSFQEARLGLDQIVRDVSDAGYPPVNQIEDMAVLSPQDYAVTPVAWSPNYPNIPCLMSGGCNTPERWGMFIETNTTQVYGQMQYIRYKLVGTTLLRGVFPKSGPNPDPYTTIQDNQLVPFVQNVMNNATPAQMAQIQAVYPGMFPGGTPVPLFQYWCDVPGSAPVDCNGPLAGPDGIPTNIRAVTIRLIVMTPTPDPQSGQVRVIELTGRGTRMNSFQ